MSYTVRLIRDAATHYTFPVTPFIAPAHAYNYDEQEPPALVSVRKTWRIRGRLHGASEAAVITAWDALKAKIEDPTALPDGIELQRSGTTVESITTDGGYLGWKVESCELLDQDLSWRGFLEYLIVVSGTKRHATSGTIGDLTLVESWSYDESGLLTRTLRGEVEVLSGSAEETARTLGLALPGTNFAFVTNGPEGVDVEVLDRADKKARFVSTVGESGLTLPAGVGPSFSVSVETSVADGEQVTTTRVTAVGVGAEAAVKSQRPAGKATESIQKDNFRRTASAVYVQKKAATGTNQVTRTHKFRSSGGGRPLRWSRRSGGRAPVKHPGAFAEVTITETIRVEVLGTPGTDDFKLPAPLVGVDEDTNGFEISGPERIETGKDRKGDKWSVEVKRVYRAAAFAEAFVAVAKSAFQPGTAGKLTDETARGSEGVVSA